MASGAVVLGIFGVVLLCGGGVVGYSYMTGHMGQMSHHGMMQGTSGSPRATTLIDMRGYVFDPQTAYARVGDIVTWRNADPEAHTVTSDSTDGPLQSPSIPKGGSWSYQFTDAGTFDYHCIPHSSQDGTGSYQGMVGRIIVS